MNEQALRDRCRDSGAYPILIDLRKKPDFILPAPYYLKEPRDYTITIEITTFIGISGGAKHYYSSISAPQWRICKKEGNTEWTCGGHLCKEWDEAPRKIKSCIGGRYEIGAVRKVTKEMIEADPIRWEGYKEGYSTDAFDTREAAIAAAIFVAKNRFVGGEIKIDEYV